MFLVEIKFGTQIISFGCQKWSFSQKRLIFKGIWSKSQFFNKKFKINQFDGEIYYKHHVSGGKQVWNQN